MLQYSNPASSSTGAVTARRNDYNILLGDKVEAIAPDPSSSVRANFSEPPATKRCELFNVMTQPKRAPINNTNEVEKYPTEPAIHDDSDPLSYWE